MTQNLRDTAVSTSRAKLVENAGIEIVAEAERTAKPRDLFWPWFAANVSVFGISYAAFIYGFGVSFWQATLVGAVGITISFLLCGVVAIAGKRGSAPTMILSRAAFGVKGQKLPGVFSWLISMGWETVLAILAVLATFTVLQQLGAADAGNEVVVKIVACGIIAALIVLASIAGYHTIMRLQSVITWITAAVTVLYIALSFNQIDLAAVFAKEGAGVTGVIGAFVMVMTGFGLGWINVASDWSRYQPRHVSGGKIVFWNTFGAALSPILLVIFGLLLIGSNPDLEAGISSDPVGTLATILPAWVLVPFLITAVLGLVSGAVLGIYSSGLTLLSLGVKLPRPAAAGIDGVILTLGTVFVVFFADNFLGPFQSFLITLGVPIAAWAGIMIGDIVLRKKDYDEEALFDPAGRYGAFDWLSIGTMVVACVVGWGLVVNGFAEDAAWNNWQGYLLEPLGLGGKEGEWAWANLGVLFALVIGFVVSYFGRAKKVARQEGRA